MARNKTEKVNTPDVKPSGFGRGMLIYALLFLLIAAAILSWFYIKMAAYERSRPNYVIEKYISSVDDEKVRSLAADIVDGVSSDIQSENDCYALLKDMLTSSKYVKNINECTDYSLSYYLKYGDTLIENIVLTLGKEDKFGYTPWAIESEELMANNLCHEKTMVLSPDCSIEINGKTLDKSHITDNNTPLDLLRDFYNRYEDLPHFVTWNTGKYISDLPVIIKDAKGNAIQESDIRQEDFENNCTSTEFEEVQAIMDKYIEKYVAFTSGTHNNPYSNYYDCSQYVVENSDLQKRLKSAIGGLGFASSLGDHIDSIVINRCMNIGNDRYAADVTYTVTTTGSNGNVTTNDYCGVYIVYRDPESNKLLVEDESTY